MCILFIAINQHLEYPLIICANRDEFYQRPTRAAHQWDCGIIAGKDLQAGGTWLGVSPTGQFAAVTNLRMANQDPAARHSRGALVVKALRSQLNQTWLSEHCDNYGGFNLIYSANKELVCFNSHLKTQQTLSNGFHAISNGAMDDAWPKMAKGKQALEKQIKSNHTIIVDELLDILSDDTQAPDEQLPSTGVSYEWEKRLSSIFIQSEGYGTRASSVVLFHRNGNIRFYERSYDSKGAISQTFTTEVNP